MIKYVKNVNEREAYRFLNAAVGSWALPARLVTSTSSRSLRQLSAVDDSCGCFRHYHVTRCRNSVNRRQPHCRPLHDETTLASRNNKSASFQTNSQTCCYTQNHFYCKQSLWLTGSSFWRDCVPVDVVMQVLSVEQQRAGQRWVSTASKHKCTVSCLMLFLTLLNNKSSNDKPKFTKFQNVRHVF